MNYWLLVHVLTLAEMRVGFALTERHRNSNPAANGAQRRGVASATGACLFRGLRRRLGPDSFTGGLAKFRDPLGGAHMKYHQSTILPSIHRLLVLSRLLAGSHNPVPSARLELVQTFVVACLFIRPRFISQKIIFF